jgi:hypothetical protein
MRRRSLALVVLLVAARSAAPLGAGPAVIPLRLPSGKVLQSEVMVKDEDRAMGLMFRPSLPSDHGMLFVFDQPDFHTIWMKNCKFPIDIVWLDGDRRVVDVAPSVPPCKADPCPVYQPMRRASYVVEMNAGEAGREKVARGAALEFTLP